MREKGGTDWPLKTFTTILEGWTFSFGTTTLLTLSQCQPTTAAGPIREVGVSD
jgi:hypothetical protein